MEQSDKPVFVFFTLLDSQLGISAQALSRSLPGLFLIPLAISGCTSCTFVIVALDVDNFSSRSIILQKFRFSKVLLLCLIRQLGIASQLSLIFFHPSKDLNLFFHSYPLLFLTPKATHLSPYLPPAKVLPSGEIKLWWQLTRMRAEAVWVLV